MEQIRLQKFLANSGICSRRKAEEYILAGKVEVNGKTVTELGTKIDIEKDKVTFEGKPVSTVEEKVYILLNKPIGYVTTVKDQFNRDTVLDLIKIKEKIVPVGRLDMYTSGALILTNDGDFVYKVTHPKHEIEKTYTVRYLIPISSASSHICSRTLLPCICPKLRGISLCLAHLPLPSRIIPTCSGILSPSFSL